MKKLIFLCLMLFSGMFFGQEIEETLEVPWPKEQKWKQLYDKKELTSRLVAYIPDKENENNWTIKGRILYLYYAAENDVADVIDTYKDTFENNAPNAKMKVLEISKNRKTAIFKIENIRAEKLPHKVESELYYVFMGYDTVCIVFVSVKEKKLSTAFVKKWSEIFKNSKYSYREIKEKTDDIIGKTKCTKNFRYGFQFSAGKNRSKITKFKHSLKMI